jgi:hypothetical protein
LTLVELALFEWDIFETALLIQSPAKCEVRSVIWFLNAKVNVQRKFTNKLLLFVITLWFTLVSLPKETSRWEKFRRQCYHNKHKKFPYRPTRYVSLLSGHASYNKHNCLFSQCVLKTHYFKNLNIRWYCRFRLRDLCPPCCFYWS